MAEITKAREIDSLTLIGKMETEVKNAVKSAESLGIKRVLEVIYPADERGVTVKIGVSPAEFPFNLKGVKFEAVRAHNLPDDSVHVSEWEASVRVGNVMVRSAVYPDDFDRLLTPMPKALSNMIRQEVKSSKENKPKLKEIKDEQLRDMIDIGEHLQGQVRSLVRDAEVDTSAFLLMLEAKSIAARAATQKYGIGKAQDITFVYQSKVEGGAVHLTVPSRSFPFEHATEVYLSSAGAGVKAELPTVLGEFRGLGVIADGQLSNEEVLSKIPKAQQKKCAILDLDAIMNDPLKGLRDI